MYIKNKVKWKFIQLIFCDRFLAGGNEKPIETAITIGIQKRNIKERNDHDK